MDPKCVFVSPVHDLGGAGTVCFVHPRGLVSRYLGRPDAVSRPRDGHPGIAGHLRGHKGHGPGTTAPRHVSGNSAGRRQGRAWLRRALVRGFRATDQIDPGGRAGPAGRGQRRRFAGRDFRRTGDGSPGPNAVRKKGGRQLGEARRADQLRLGRQSGNGPVCPPAGRRVSRTAAGVAEFGQERAVDENGTRCQSVPCPISATSRVGRRPRRNRRAAQAPRLGQDGTDLPAAGRRSSGYHGPRVGRPIEADGRSVHGLYGAGAARRLDPHPVPRGKPAGVLEPTVRLAGKQRPIGLRPGGGWPEIRLDPASAGGVQRLRSASRHALCDRLPHGPRRTGSLRRQRGSRAALVGLLGRRPAGGVGGRGRPVRELSLRLQPDRDPEPARG